MPPFGGGIRRVGRNLWLGHQGFQLGKVRSAEVVAGVPLGQDIVERLPGEHQGAEALECLVTDLIDSRHQPFGGFWQHTIYIIAYFCIICNYQALANGKFAASHTHYTGFTQFLHGAADRFAREAGLGR